jgi:hypothetical protein
MNFNVSEMHSIGSEANLSFLNSFDLYTIDLMQA